MPALRGRSETRQTLPGARPNRRAQPGSPGERCAAQPSGRPHEPSGNRRPQMDGHPRRRKRRGTELGLQTASLTRRRIATHAGVAGCGPRSRDLRVRSLRCSPAPSPEPPLRRLARRSRRASPRRGGRCAAPCRRCRSGTRNRGRRGGSARAGRGAGTRRRRGARAPTSTWISRRNVQRLIRWGASRYASGSGGTIGSGRAIEFDWASIDGSGT